MFSPRQPQVQRQCITGVAYFTFRDADFPLSVGYLVNDKSMSWLYA